MPFKIKFAPASEDGGVSATDFTNMYLVFLGQADAPTRAKSIEESRNAYKILDAMDSISRITLDPQQGPVRSLNEDGGDLILTEQMKALLVSSVETFLATAPFASVKAGIRVESLLLSAEEVKAPEGPKLV